MRFVILMTLLLLSVTHFAFADPGDSCQANSDCDEGEHCRQQVCVARSGRSQSPAGIQEDQSSPTYQPGNSGAAAVGVGSNICITPLLSCGLPQQGPSGMACYCNTFRGPISGFVR
jgi:hypothetical protein